MMQDKTQDRYSQKVFLNEVSVYIWELTRRINSHKELTWVGKGFLNDLDWAYLPSMKSKVSHRISTLHPTI